MASENGEHGEGGHGEQSQSWSPPPQHEWARESQSDEPEEATVARPMSHPLPPPAAEDAGDTPASRDSDAGQPSENVSGPTEQVPRPPSDDDDRTQSFSRPDVRYGVPTPTQQLPAFPPPPPSAPYQPGEQQGFAPPPYAPPTQQPTPQPPPFGPGGPPYQQTPQGYPPAQAPGYGQAPYQGEPSYPQQPYGAAPPQYGQYEQYGQQSPHTQYEQYPQYDQYGQYGQYGQQPPPYGGYAPPAAPKKRHVWPWVGVVAIVVVAALVAASFVAKPGFLGFKKVLDHSAVEQQIEKGGYTNVVCNDGKNPTVKKGATFTCTADGGKKVTVTITSSDGDYAWSPSS